MFLEKTTLYQRNVSISTGKNNLAIPRTQWTMTNTSLRTLCALNQRLGADVSVHRSCLGWIKISVKFAPASSFQVWYCAIQFNSQMLMDIRASRWHLQELCLQVCTVNSTHHSVVEGSIVMSFPYLWIFWEIDKLQQWKKMLLTHPYSPCEPWLCLPLQLHARNLDASRNSAMQAVIHPDGFQ